MCTSRKQQNALIIGESLDFLLLEIGGFNAGTFMFYNISFSLQCDCRMKTNFLLQKLNQIERKRLKIYNLKVCWTENRFECNDYRSIFIFSILG